MGYVIRRPTVYVVTCKRCSRDVPAGIQEFPLNPIIVECQLCGENRRYRMTEIFLGRPSHLCAKQSQGVRTKGRGLREA